MPLLDYTVPELLWHWVLVVTYLLFSLSFLLFGYVLFKRYKGGRYPRYKPSTGSKAIAVITFVCMVVATLSAAC